MQHLGFCSKSPSPRQHQSLAAHRICTTTRWSPQMLRWIIWNPERRRWIWRNVGLPNAFFGIWTGMSQSSQKQLHASKNSPFSSEWNASDPQWRLRGWKSTEWRFHQKPGRRENYVPGQILAQNLENIIQPQHGVMHVGHATSINFLPHKEKVKVPSDFSNQISASSKLQTSPVSSTYRVRSTLSFGSFTTTALSLAAWMVWQDAWHVLGQMPILPMNSS